MEHLYRKEKIKRYITIGAAGVFLFIIVWVVLGFGDEEKVQDTTPAADIEVIEKEKTLDESIKAKFSKKS